MTTKLLLHEFTRTELAALAPNALLVLPTGAIEQHGPHLPVGTDFFAVEYVARTAAAEAAAQIPVLVTPTMPFGSSHHHLPFGGTKATGNGHREAGTQVLDIFSEWKSVYVDYSGKLQRAQIDNA